MTKLCIEKTLKLRFYLPLQIVKRRRISDYAYVVEAYCAQLDILVQWTSWV